MAPEPKKITKRKGHLVSAGLLFKDKNEKIQGKQEMTDSLQRLIEATEKHQKTVLSPENREAIAELKEAYKNSLLSVVDIIKKSHEHMTAEQKDISKKLRRALSKDYRVLCNYEKRLDDEKKPATAFITFEELLETSRSKRIEVRQKDIEYEGAGQHARAVIESEDKKYYFTSSEKPSTFNEIADKLVAEAKEKYGPVANFLDNPDAYDALLDFANAHGTKHYYDALPQYGITTSSLDLATVDHAQATRTAWFIAGRKNRFINAANMNPEQFRIFVEVGEKLGKAGTAIGMAAGEGMLKDACYDKRNSAMSMVADILGMPDVIAHSENMHLVVRTKNGKKVIKGTAMAAADGEDITKVNSRSNFAGVSASSFENPSLIRDISNLQVLDYICGNPDRHEKNMVYKVTPDGRVIGIQGIDNDTSFGTKFVANGRNFRAVPPEHFGLIPRSTAEKILNTDPEALKLMLFGFDLSPGEVNASLKRLNYLKNVITHSMKTYKDYDIEEGIVLDGIPRIVDDDKIDQYSILHDLTVKYKVGQDSVGNLFAPISQRNPVRVDDIIVKNNYNKACELPKEVLTIGAGKLRLITEDVKNPDKKYQKGSRQYTDMRNNVEELYRKIVTFDKKMIDKQFFGDYSLTTEANNLKKLIKDTLTATNKYITDRALKKPQIKNRQTNTREWKRYMAALKVKEELERQLEAFKKAEAALDDNERQARHYNVNRTYCEQRDTEYDNTVLKEKYTRFRSPERAVTKYIKERTQDLCYTYTADSLKSKCALLEIDIAAGMKAGMTKDPASLKNDDPEAYARFRKGVAACILLDRIETGKLKDFKSRDKETHYEEIMNNPAFEKAISQIKNPLTMEDFTKFANRKPGDITFNKRMAVRFNKAEAAAKRQNNPVL